MCTPNDKDSKHRGGKMLIMTSTDCAAGSISYACTFKLTSTQTCITKKTHTVNQNTKNMRMKYKHYTMKTFSNVVTLFNYIKRSHTNISTTHVRIHTLMHCNNVATSRNTFNNNSITYHIYCTTGTLHHLSCYTHLLTTSSFPPSLPPLAKLIIKFHIQTFYPIIATEYTISS